VSALPESRPVIRCSDDIDRLVRADLVDQEQEHLRIVLLNTRHQVMGMRTVYVGSVHSAVVRVSELLRDAGGERTARTSSSCITIRLATPRPARMTLR
jgi:DNA repair protein RadC